MKGEYHRKGEEKTEQPMLTVVAGNDPDDLCFLLRGLIAIAGEGITLSNEKGEFRIYNAAMEKLTGYTMEEVNSCIDPLLLLYPDPVEYLRLLRQSRERHHGEAVMIRAKDGTLKTVRVTMTIMQKDGVDYVLSIYHDISTRMKVETELHLSEKKYRTLFESSRDAIMVLGHQGFVDCNEATCTLFGCAGKEEFIGRLPSELSPLTQQDGVDSFIAAIHHMEIAHTTGSHFFEWLHKKMDGTVFPAEVLLSRYNFSGEVMLQAVVRDITARKQAEAKLLDYFMELRIANRAKSAFLDNMSHEMTTPLNGIIGFSELLLDELYGTLNEYQKQYVSNIHQCGKHLHGLIFDIFALIDAESSLMKMVVSTFTLKDLLRRAMMRVRQKALNRNLTLRLEIEPAADREIEADAAKLWEIIRNLMDNGMKFTPDGGSIAVHARFYKAGEPCGDGQAGLPGERGDVVEISVIDTGIGIRPETMPSLFSVFHQVDSPYNKEYDGIGVGLALTKKLIELLHGRIWIKSAPGKGTTFSFIIPVLQSEKQHSLDPADFPSAGGS